LPPLLDALALRAVAGLHVLAGSGEGLHHLAAYVEDADDAIASFAAASYSVAQEGRGFGVDGDGAFVYFDTEHELGTCSKSCSRLRRAASPSSSFRSSAQDP
jgi:hypothetical protein